MSQWIKTVSTPPIATVTLARPELHNAFDAGMIASLRETFETLGNVPEIRAIVLAAEGKSFCAGADLQWMKSMLNYTFEENVADAEALARMLQAIVQCPKPVIGRIHGAAFGGGVGLTSVCDLTVALPNVPFSLSEVKLGLLPAVISPFVLRKMPRAYAHRYFLTAERFSAEAALQMGFISAIAPDEAAMDAQIQQWVEVLCQNGPEAVGLCKKLIEEVAALSDLEAAIDLTTQQIAARRISEEGQEGMRAFLEKRPSRWVQEASGVS